MRSAFSKVRATIPSYSYEIRGGKLGVSLSETETPGETPSSCRQLITALQQSDLPPTYIKQAVDTLESLEEFFAPKGTPVDLFHTITKGAGPDAEIALIVALFTKAELQSIRDLYEENKPTYSGDRIPPFATFMGHLAVHRESGLEVEGPADFANLVGLKAAYNTFDFASHCGLLKRAYTIDKNPSWPYLTPNRVVSFCAFGLHEQSNTSLPGAVKDQAAFLLENPDNCPSLEILKTAEFVRDMDRGSLVSMIESSIVSARKAFTSHHVDAANFPFEDVAILLSASQLGRGGVEKRAVDQMFKFQEKGRQVLSRLIDTGGVSLYTGHANLGEGIVPVNFYSTKTTAELAGSKFSFHATPIPGIVGGTRRGSDTRARVRSFDERLTSAVNAPSVIEKLVENRRSSGIANSVFGMMRLEIERVNDQVKKKGPTSPSM